MKWVVTILVLSLSTVAFADDDLVALFAGSSGRIVKTASGYRTDNAVIIRTSTGYRASMRDGRTVLLTRIAGGNWRSRVVGDAAADGARTYFRHMNRR